MYGLNNVEVKCPLCGAWLSLKPTKAGKPHAFCIDCGWEMFVRKEAGINIIKAALKERKVGFVRQVRE